MFKFLCIHLRYVNAIVIRMFLVILSEILSKFNFSYTDMNYQVLNDGAKHLLSIESPYNRETYRDSPILAMMMIPNNIINFNCGKMIFVIIDILNGVFIEVLLNLQNYNRKNNLAHKDKLNKLNKEIPTENIPIFESNINFSDNSSNISTNNSNSTTNNNLNTQNNSAEKAAAKINEIFEILKKIIDNPFSISSLFYLYNPFIINICTRGNADCLIIFFMLISLIFIELRIYSLAGVFYGLAIHFKIYPLVYAPAILLYIITRRHNTFGEIDNQNFDNQNSVQISSKSKTSIVKNPITIITNLIFSFFSIYFYLNIIHSIYRKIRNFYACIFRNLGKLMKFIFKFFLNFNAIVFFAFALIIYVNLFGFFYLFFGQKFAYQYLIYQIAGKDFRMNYSIFSYLMSLVNASNFGKILSLLACLPQFILLFFTTIFMFRDLNNCLIIITWIFVSFNRAVTSHNHLWYISLIPLIMPFNKMFLQKKVKATVLLGLWLYFEFYWNSLSYRLEFKGENVFMEIWIFNMIFFLINCVFIEEIASESIFKKAIK